MTPKETPPRPATPAPTCPVCGHPVRVISADEGTAHYEPIEVAATARVLGPMSAVKVLSWLHERVAARSPVLDVERLASAMATVRRESVSPAAKAEGGWTMLSEHDAAVIAAEYARLAEPASEASDA